MVGTLPPFDVLEFMKLASIYFIRSERFSHSKSCHCRTSQTTNCKTSVPTFCVPRPKTNKEHSKTRRNERTWISPLRGLGYDELSLNSPPPPAPIRLTHKRRRKSSVLSVDPSGLTSVTKAIINLLFNPKLPSLPEISSPEFASSNTGTGTESQVRLTLTTRSPCRAIEIPPRHRQVGDLHHRLHWCSINACPFPGHRPLHSCAHGSDFVSRPGDIPRALVQFLCSHKRCSTPTKTLIIPSSLMTSYLWTDNQTQRNGSR